MGVYIERFYSETCSIYKGNILKVSLLKYYESAQTITPVQVGTGGTPCRLTYKDTENISEQINGSEFSYSILADENFDVADIYSTGDKDWKLEFRLNGQLEWSGFVQPDAYEEPFKTKPYEIELRAVDMLAKLSDKPISFDTTKGKATIIQTIAECLKATGNSLDIAICSTLKGANGGGSVNAELWGLELARFLDKDNNRLACEDVLKSCLNILGARLFLTKGKWYITNTILNANGSVNYRLYNPQGETKGNFNENFEYSAGDKAKDFELKDGTVKMLNPVKDIVAYYQYGLGSNKLLNGDFSLMQAGAIDYFTYWHAENGAAYSGGTRKVQTSAGEAETDDVFMIVNKANVDTKSYIINTNPINVRDSQQVTISYLIGLPKLNTVVHLIYSFLVIKRSDGKYLRNWKWQNTSDNASRYIAILKQAEWVSEVAFFAVTVPDNEPSSVKSVSVTLDVTLFKGESQIQIGVSELISDAPTYTNQKYTGQIQQRNLEAHIDNIVVAIQDNDAVKPVIGEYHQNTNLIETTEKLDAFVMLNGIDYRYDITTKNSVFRSGAELLNGGLYGNNQKLTIASISDGPNNNLLTLLAKDLSKLHFKPVIVFKGIFISNNGAAPRPLNYFKLQTFDGKKMLTAGGTWDYHKEQYTLKVIELNTADVAYTDNGIINDTGDKKDKAGVSVGAIGGVGNTQTATVNIPYDTFITKEQTDGWYYKRTDKVDNAARADNATNADNSVKWNGKTYGEIIDQPVRTTDNVTFNSTAVTKATVSNELVIPKNSNTGLNEYAGYIREGGTKLNAGKSDYADDSDKWDGYQFADYLNQAVKKDSNVTFAQVVAAAASITASLSIPLNSSTGLNILNGYIRNNVIKLSAGNADLWDNHIFSDYINQTLRTDSSVQFKIVKALEALILPLNVTVGLTYNELNYLLYAGNKIKAGYSDDSDKWDGYQFADYLDSTQPVRPQDAVKFLRVITGEITSSNYVSGFTGAGHRLLNGNLELDNLTVRKEFSVNTLNVREILGTGGSFVVTNNAKINSVVEYPTYYSCSVYDSKDDKIYNQLRVNDIVRCQVFDGKRVKYYTARVQAVSTYIFDLAKDSFTGSGRPEKGDMVFQFGNLTDTSRQGLLYLTNSDTGAPYFDVLDGVTSDNLAGKTKVRAGRLDGITDADLGTLSGYGFYGQNVYLKGEFILKSGGKSNIYTKGEADTNGAAVLKDAKTAAKELVDAVSVGSVNILKNSEVVKFNGDGQPCVTYTADGLEWAYYTSTKPNGSFWKYFRLKSENINYLTTELIPDTYYTLSVRCNGTTPFEIGLWDYSVTTGVINGAADKRISLTFKYTAAMAASVNGGLWINIRNIGNGSNNWSVSCREWQLEQGNKATPWKPAYTDLMQYANDKLAAYDTTLFQVGSGKVLSAIGGYQFADGVTLADMKSKYLQTKDGFSWSVQQVNSFFDSGSNKIKNAVIDESNLNQSTRNNIANDAQTKATTAKNDAVSAAASDATTKANAAQSAAISTAAGDATTKANGAKTDAINAAATDATNKANTAEGNAKTYAKNQLDGLVIGGENMLNNSDFSFGFDSWINNGGLTTVVDSDLGKSLLLQSTAYGHGRYQHVKGFEIGKKYTLSLYVSVIYLESLTSLVGVEGATGVGPYTNSNAWERKAVTFTAANTEYAVTLYGFNGRQDVKFAKLQLEQGDKATAWKPSQSDTKARIADAKAAGANAASDIATFKKDYNTYTEQTAAAINSKADVSVVNAQGVRVGTLESNQSQQAGSITAMAKDIKLLNTGLNTWVLDLYENPPGGDFYKPAGTPPTYEDTTNKVKKAGNVLAYAADKTGNIIYNIGDNYIGVARTAVFVAAAKTINYTFATDDAGAVYLNGDLIKTTVSSTQTTVSLKLNAGWNDVEVFWNEAGGGDGFYSVQEALNTLVDKMDAAYFQSIGINRYMQQRAEGINARFKDYSTTQQLPTLISSEVGSYKYGEAGETIAQAISRSVQTSQGFNKAITGIDITGNKNLSTYINETAGDISKTVSSNDIKALQIGGRNLLLKSQKVSFNKNASNDSVYESTVNGKAGYVYVSNTANSSFYHFFKVDSINELAEPLVVGETYTLSAYFISSTPFKFGLFDFQSSTPQINESKGRQSLTFVYTAYLSRQNQVINIQNITGTNTGWSVFASEWQLEKGNKATDWSPAVEDVQAQFGEYTKTVQLPGKISSEVGALKFGSNNETITQIASKASQTKEGFERVINGIDVNTNGSILTKITESASGVTTAINKAVKDKDGSEVGQLSSLARQTAEGFNRAVTGIDLTGARTLKTYVDEQAGAVTTLVKDLKISGRNLIRNAAYLTFNRSGAGSEWTWTADNSNGYGYVNKKVFGIASAAASDTWYRFADLVHKLEAGKKYTLSFFVITGTPFSIGVFDVWQKDFGGVIGRIGITFTATPSMVTDGRLIINLKNTYANTSSNFAEWQLEEGERFTDFAPADEDIQSQFGEYTKTTQLPNKISTEVGTLKFGANGETITDIATKAEQTKTGFNRAVQGVDLSGTRTLKTVIDESAAGVVTTVQNSVRDKDNTYLGVMSTTVKQLSDSWVLKLKSGPDIVGEINATPDNYKVNFAHINFTGAVTIDSFKKGSTADALLNVNGLVKAEKIETVDLLAQKMRTATSGERVEINTDGGNAINTYNAAGELAVNIDDNNAIIGWEYYGPGQPPGFQSWWKWHKGRGSMSGGQVYELDSYFTPIYGAGIKISGTGSNKTTLSGAEISTPAITTNNIIAGSVKAEEVITGNFSIQATDLDATDSGKTFYSPLSITSILFIDMGYRTTDVTIQLPEIYNMQSVRIYMSGGNGGALCYVRHKNYDDGSLQTTQVYGKLELLGYRNGSRILN